MTVRTHLLSPALFVALLVASGSLAACTGTQFGEEEGVGCLPVNTTVLALEEPSPLGFSGQDLLDGLAPAYGGDLVYGDGSRTELSLTVAHDGGEVRFQDNEWVSEDGTDIAPALGCPDTVEVDTRVRFETADGSFAEEWSEVLVAVDGSGAAFQRDLDGLEGTYDAEAHVPAGTEYDELRAFVDATLGATGAQGEVSGIASRTSGSGPDGTASATMLELASFDADARDTNAESTGCLPRETTTLGAEEPSPLGFSADDVLTWAEGSYELDLEYADGTTTPATLEVTYEGGAIEFRDNEWMAPSDGSEVAPQLGCQDDLQIEVTLAFRSDDGTFDEQWTERLVATDAGRATLYRDLGETTGAFDAAGYAPAGHDYDSVRAFLELTLEAGGTAGTITGQGEGSTGTGPEGTAFAESFPIASWGEA